MEKGSKLRNDDNARLERKRMISKRRLMQRQGGNDGPSHDDGDEEEMHGSSFLPDWNAATALEDDDDDSDQEEILVSESETEDDEPAEDSTNSPVKARRPRSKRIPRGLRRGGSERRKVKDRSLSSRRRKSNLHKINHPTPVRRSSSRSNVYQQEPEEEENPLTLAKQNSDRSLGARQNSFHNKSSNNNNNRPPVTRAVERQLSARGLTPSSLALSSSNHQVSSSLRMTPVRGNSFRGGSLALSDTETVDEQIGMEEMRQSRHHRRPFPKGMDHKNGSASLHKHGGNNMGLLMNNTDDDEDEQFLFVE